VATRSWGILSASYSVYVWGYRYHEPILPVIVWEKFPSENKKKTQKEGGSFFRYTPTLFFPPKKNMTKKKIFLTKKIKKNMEERKKEKFWKFFPKKNKNWKEKPTMPAKLITICYVIECAKRLTWDFMV